MQSLSTQWNGKLIAATAHLVPRFAWMTASIDVAINENVVIRTGGVPKLEGELPSTFELNGSEHQIRVTWGKAKPKAFPITVLIDNQVVISGDVPIANWWLAYWPWLAIAAFCLWLNLK